MTPSIYDWSTTPANNATADASINWQEGQAPSTVNNSARVMMERVKELLNDLGGVNTATGTANTISLTTSSPFSAYSDGIRVVFRAAATNTGAATLNANSVGSKNIYVLSAAGTTPTTGGEIVAGYLIEAFYFSSLNSGAGGWLIPNPSVSTQVAPLSQGHLYGLTLSNNASDAVNDIDVSSGFAAADISPFNVMSLASSITKRLDANWAVGTNQGGLDTGSVANTSYHVYLMQRPDTGVVDVCFSASAVAPTTGGAIPVAYNRFRRIGSIIRLGATILAFKQFGDKFILTTPGLTLNSTTTFAATLTAATTPSGIVVEAMFTSAMSLNGSSSANYNVGHAFQGGVTFAPHIMVTGAGNSESDATNFSAFTDTSSRVYMSQQVVSGSIFSHTVNTNGWIDTRGRI